MKPEFLETDDILVLHDLHLARFGGSAGIRDLALLESAVNQARASFGGKFLDRDLAAMASASQVSIVKNHPFQDGNKRAGLAAMLTFLDLNGINIDHSSGLLYDAMMTVAEGRFDKAGLAEILRQWVVESV